MERVGFLSLQNKSAIWITLLTIGFFIVGSKLAYAQAGSEVAQQLLQTLKDRDREIAARDALIADLQKRVERLEHLAGTTPQQPLPPNQERQSSSAPPSPEEKESTPETTLSKNSVSVAQTQPQQESTKKKAAAPGTVEVDEQAAERALERTLTQVGALLLPFGLMEVQPFFTYTRREQSFPALVSTAGGQALINAEIHRNEFNPGLFTRFGLPFDSQLEFNLPVQIVDQTTVGYNQQTDRLGSSLGDISVGIAKTLFHEHNWSPDLIARVTWDTGTSQRVSNGIAFGGGFSSILGSLTALKRQDPLAFIGNVFYQSYLEEDHIKLGDKFGFSIGTLLAASPDTSLRLQLQQIFSQKTEVNGNIIPGSSQVSSVFILGASSMLGRGVLLSVSGGIGLTENSPNYFINFTLPIRFGLPFLQ